MRLPASLLCSLFLAGCVSHRGAPIASASGASTPAVPDTSVEVRHMYLFTPGKNPVLVVDRGDSSSTPQEVSSEPPATR